jgi:hypothetical protein
VTGGVAAVTGPSPGAVDVGRNARAVEFLKAELVASAGAVLRGLVRGREEETLDGLAQTLAAAYLLARRLGIPFARLDLRLEGFLRANAEQGHQLERWYGDVTALLAHLEQRRGGT